MEKLQRGRPPKPSDESLSERIDIRVTTAEKVDLAQAAESAGMTLSQWMRDRLRAAARREVRRAKEKR
jgi:uncharacterized protein (DUF1778 family)